MFHPVRGPRWTPVVGRSFTARENGLMNLLILAGALVTTLAQPRTTRTPDYVERIGDRARVVTFTGDELAAPPGGPFGDRVRALPGTVRVGLVRPRLNFVGELLVSVENL